MSDIIDFRRDNLADVPAFFTGVSASSLVPDVFPVAIDGRPYMIDQKSKQFIRGFEPRIRDSVDQGVEPGEATINPQGLWRRNQTSWHSGAGQVYGDVDSAPYRFFKSKGVNPWSKGQLSLLSATKRSLESANTNLFTCVVESGGTQYLYVADGATVKFSSNPFDTTPTWTSVTTATSGTLPTTAITGLETNGTNVLSEHPECRPDALSSRCLQTAFYFSILKREFVFGNKTSRRIIAGVNDLLFGKNMKFAVAGEAVVGAGCVVLKFVVSPTPIACT